MSEKTDPTAMKPRGCERGEELVAYLYGEATKQEAGLFSKHLDACAVCREELAAFGGVRAGLGAWRAEALGTVPSLNLVDAFAPATEPRPSVRRRSARAALREFFSLSPLWLRAGAFAATLAVCALFALTLSRAEVRWGSDGLALRTGVTEKAVVEQIQAPPPQVGYTDEQVNAIVAQKVAAATAQLTAKVKEETEGQRPDTVINVSGSGKSQQQTTNAPRRKRPARADSRREEPLLAEDDLPRLSDLLSGSY